MEEQRVKPIYRMVIQALSEGDLESGIKILSDATKVYDTHGRTDTGSYVFVRGIRHVKTQYGSLSRIPKSDLEYHRETLKGIVREYPYSIITYTVYNNGFSGVKIGNLPPIENQILTFSGKTMVIWDLGMPSFN